MLGLGGLATQALVLGFVVAAPFGALPRLRDARVAAKRSVPMAPFLSSREAMAALLPPATLGAGASPSEVQACVPGDSRSHIGHDRVLNTSKKRRTSTCSFSVRRTQQGERARYVDML